MGNGHTPQTTLGREGGGSKLPPGGSWEIVEEAELRDEVPVELVKPGKEAVRSDVQDVLNGAYDDPSS